MTKHPAGIKNSSKFVNGEWSVYVGRPVKIKFTGGDWEAGTRFTTQVWTSKTKNFTDADYTANVSQVGAIVREADASAPTLSFVPINRDSGRYVWISIMGQAPGKAPWLFTFEPELVRG